jgi:tetratricopeptide (TPR) repeat protein
MKKTILTLLLTLAALTAYGQKMPSDYFEEADGYFAQKKYDEALTGYQYIVDNHPRSKYYPKALLNAGCIRFFQEDYEFATVIFKKVLQCKSRESAVDGTDDPYANYKHKASTILSAIYYKRREYKESLHYLQLADSAYPCRNISDKELAENKIESAIVYADIYQGLEQPDKAIGKLMGSAWLDGTADNSAIIDRLHGLLAKKKGARKQLDAALNNIYEKRTAQGKNTTYCINYMGFEIEIPMEYVYGPLAGKPYDKKKTIGLLKKSNFYNMMKTL